MSETPSPERPEAPEGMYYRGPTRELKPDGTPLRRGGFAWKPGRKPKPETGSETPPENPEAGDSPDSSSKNEPQQGKKGRAAVTVTIAAAAGAVTLGLALSSSSSSGETLTVQVKGDLSQSIAALAKLGYDISGEASRNPSGGTDCAATATKHVRQFLMQHPCKEYAVSTFTVAKSGIKTRVAVTWVVMPTSSLAEKYKFWADARERGNPPGQPEADFTGLCYASGQAGTTVWAEQVQPTDHSGVDQTILRAMAPSKLSTPYLRVHCLT